tara:strand:+ start:3767 stop:5713 length:1947 start_codon:yes stop_codon:yes gene_type:complete
MPFTKFTNLDYDQIKTSIKDYLRANSTFTGFDFEGSNFSVLIDTLAYNTYITAFNSNMIVNESFLDSATLRENVVSLARNIGYVPRSRTASTAEVSFSLTVPNKTPADIPNVTLQAGLVAVGNVNDTSYVFSTPQDVSAPSQSSGSDIIANFNNVEIREGTFLQKVFTVDASLDQRFVLDNEGVDTSTIKVYVNDERDGGGNLLAQLGVEYSVVDNILNVDANSLIYLLQEVQDERYEILFGDGLIGKKLENGARITVRYVVTDGAGGNGARDFSFSGKITNSSDSYSPIPLTLSDSPTLITDQPSQNGSDIESVSSIKYYAPRIYSSQYRAVTPRDYEAIIKKIYPDTQSVAVVGGEEMDPPEFGNVLISIKPKNGSFVSDFNKSRILSQLKQYSVSGINQKILDLKMLYVEIDSSVYYDNNKVSTSSALRTSIINALTTYSNSVDMNKFGGRFKYSKVQQVIDSTDTAITSNITRVRLRRDLKCALNQFAQYELCFGNRFYVNSEGYNIKSTGFYIDGTTKPVYLTDVPNTDKLTGDISIVSLADDGTTTIIIKSAGTVDYVKGEILLGTINITGTLDGSGVVEVQAIPQSNDVVGLKELYVEFSVSKSTINMVRDVIASGDEITGTTFTRDFYTSSYLNGQLIRQ